MKLKVALGAMSPELMLPLPFTDVTVWWAESLFVQVTVLLTPITRVILSGEYPGAPLAFPAPVGIDTMTVAGAASAGRAAVNPEMNKTARRPAAAEARIDIS